MNRKHILYAEDEFTNRKIMEIQCRRFGVECDLVEDGPTALEMLKNDDYDLVILDQYMPGMNGDDVARVFRSRNRKTPLVAITSDDAQVRNLMSSGFDRVYIKPLRTDSYRQILQDILQEARL